MKFALISNPRTGSTALCNYFRDIGVFVFHEPFRPSKRGYASIGIELKQMYSRSGAQGIKHILTHLDHQDNRRVFRWLISHGIKIIALRRNDTVMMALSLEIARQTNIWEVRRSDPQLGLQYENRELYEIPIESIYESIRKLKKNDEIFDEFHQYVDFINYEDLFSLGLDITGHWIEFLFQDLKLQKPPYYKKIIEEHFGKTMKHNQLKTYENIPNWKEIKDEFNIKG